MSRVALVTGASGGIGSAIAVALAEAGHAVAIGFSSNRDAAAITAKDCESAGARALPVEIDVADSASVDAAFGEIERQLGAVEILVNNAGVTADGLLLRMSDDQWRRVLATNLDGAFNCTRRAAPRLVRARWGRIVNVGSVAAFAGAAGQANYAAAKAGLVGFTRATARELAGRGVTSNLVAPGPITTAMTDELSDDRRAELTKLVPLARFGTPDEVAAVVAFLCTEAAAYITGAVIPVDGGLGMGY
ncbi:MAG: 3-oxoacyl-ACP reductase FabG [Acidimicrobiia bacterium]